MTAVAPARTQRGTTNRNDRGSSYDRRARRAWLLATFGDGITAPCFRCGVLLTWETLTVDRITPGRDGTYARGNIRPSCGADNFELGGRLAANRPTVIGVDPGPIPGIAVIRPDGQTESLQVTAGVVMTVLRALVATAPELPDPDRGVWVRRAVLAVEKYVVGGRSSRTTSPQAQATTRNMVGAVEALGAELGVPVRLRPAADVKRWATCGAPTRLERAGLSPTGMVHARSAGWHALYCAVHDAGMPDPLSRRGRS